MSEKLEKVIGIANLAEHSDYIELWTPSFKVKGTLIKDLDKAVDGVITVKHATVCPHFGECSCKPDTVTHEWLNVFEDQVIAFTVIKK